MPSFIFSTLPIVLFLVSVSPSSALCWIDRERPTTADQLQITNPRVAGARATAQALNRIFKGNATLQQLPDVRVRSTWQVTGHPNTGSPYGVHLVLWAHGKGAWAGECELIPQADRLEPSAAIVVQTNTVNSTLTQRVSSVRDEQLQAFIEPERIGQIGKHAVYKGQLIVVTFDGRLPWVPVTTAEYLASEERRLVTLQAEADRNIADASARAGQFDEKALQDIYESMKKTNPAEAEKFRAMMDEVKRQSQKAAENAPPITNAYTKQLADLRALRASLTSAQLQEQARDGYNAITPLAPIDRLPKLVKLDPAFPWDRTNPNRVRMMEIHFSGRGEPYNALMHQAANTFDWTAIEALMK